MNASQTILDTVHACYHGHDWNCARTTLAALSALNDFPLREQVLHAAIGMHGAGCFRAQCGLVEGGLMFLGTYFHARGEKDGKIGRLCRAFAEAFQKEFGSLSCRDLRPGGFQKSDPPHLCEDLTVRAITFTQRFLQEKRDAASRA